MNCYKIGDLFFCNMHIILTTYILISILSFLIQVIISNLNLHSSMRPHMGGKFLKFLVVLHHVHVHTFVCVCKFKSLHLKQSTFLLILQHDILILSSR